MKNRGLLAALASGTVLLAGCGGEAGGSDDPPQRPSGTAKAPKTVPLGPSGYGALKLGMTLAQAEATGLIKVKTKPGAGCGMFDLKAHPHPENAAGGYISARYGVASIFAAPGMATPEGIRVGSSLAEVQKAYPRLQKGPNASSVLLPGKPRALYGLLMAGGRVNELALDLQVQDCHN